MVIKVMTEFLLDVDFMRQNKGLAVTKNKTIMTIYCNINQLKDGIFVFNVPFIKQNKGFK